MGAYIDTDSASGKQKVTETFTCPHHNTIHPLYDDEGRKIAVAMCRKCMRPVCDACVMLEAKGENMCIPIDVRLSKFEFAVARAIERQERTDSLLKACGLA